MQQQAAQIATEQQQQQDKLEQQQQSAAAGQDSGFDTLEAQQLLEQRSVADSAVEVLAASGQQQRAQLLQDGQPPSAGLHARPLGSGDFSGSGEQEYTGEDEGAQGEEDADRDLSVACQQAEENKLSFQLKFTEPEGEWCRRVQTGADGTPQQAVVCSHMISRVDHNTTFTQLTS